MLWLYLLGVVTLLIIVLRRVLRRQKPLTDELYSTRVAIDHVHSGVAWVRGDGTIGSANSSLSATLGIDNKALLGRDWLSLFPELERDHMREVYRQMLLIGKASVESKALRANATMAPVQVLLVAVHDHKTRLFGHYCLVEDCARERQLEEQVAELTRQLEGSGQTALAR
jgi:PAS domain S-box-containing protein